MAREGLKSELPGAIYRASTLKIDVTLKELLIKTNGEYETVNVSISPFIQPDSMNGLLLVVFEDVIAEKTPVTSDTEYLSINDLDVKYLQIEKELALTKDRLQSTVEEMETTQEELKSANEELQSTNEELQSTNV